MNGGYIIVDFKDSSLTGTITAKTTVPAGTYKIVEQAYKSKKQLYLINGKDGNNNIYNCRPVLRNTYDGDGVYILKCVDLELYITSDDEMWKN